MRTTRCPLPLLLLCACVGGEADGPEFEFAGPTAGAPDEPTADAGDADDDVPEPEPPATTGDDGDDDPTGAETGKPPDEPGPEVCALHSLSAAELRPALVFVLDRSSSMVDDSVESYGADPEGESKWSRLHGLVTEAVGELSGRARIGALTFPSTQGDPQSPGSECAVAEAPLVGLDEGAGAIASAIPAANAHGFFGASPLGAAVAVAGEHLIDADPQAPRAIIVVSDGAANCSGDDPWADHDTSVVGAIADLREAWGIFTFVVGVGVELEGHEVPAVNNYIELNKLAAAGGQPRRPDGAFYPVDAVDELTAAVDGMTRAWQCTVAPELAGVDPEKLNVRLGDEPLARVERCDEGAGWVASDDERGAITLCADACERFVAGDPLDVERIC